ncbi:cation:proton antiporter [Coralloluteibacterium stylophorae]|uniref:Sodium:proton antiporter n=1 Tax=Coralloluteibacterium stylophorae TaxID=1776034 RepID=A0A8J8AWN7_9GAMM|nr:sodium:proton antiporter [Coralloluteibacterium stylophorae]MBS7455556.1 sodium:proton antiporter [Coralloluteibacterium stylophorae]
MLDLAAVFLCITAVVAYLNRRFVGLPSVIGVMGIALVLSLLAIGLDALGFGMLRSYEESLLREIDFSDVLMEGMLSLLLFAGALHIDLSQLRAYRWQIGLLAVVGTVASTLVVGFALWSVLSLFSIGLPLAYCLIFGALISPTDPIAVMGILRSAGAPHSVELVIAGESLFNDGVGVVVFSLLLAVVAGGHVPGAAEGGLLLLEEAGGGIALGLAIGFVTYQMLRRIDSYQEEVLITLAAVIGGYALASHLHVSGPLAMVVVGLIVGNQGRARAMSDTTRRHIDMFWELVDEILNAVLFVLIGLEVILIAFSGELLLTGLAVIALTLTARLATVGLPIRLLGERFRLPRGSWRILTWGGLRGGISVALALSLPAGPERDIVVALTYMVVVFSILAQGLTIGKVVRRVFREEHVG